MVCVSTQHSCWAKNRWDPDLPVDPLEPPSWMLNSDPQRESDLFFLVNNPFHRLESFMCRNTWASLRFQRWGSWLQSIAFVCWDRQHLELECGKAWQHTGLFSAFQTHVRQTGSPWSCDLFWGKGERKCHMQVKKKNIFGIKRNNWSGHQRDKFWSVDKYVTIIFRYRCWSRLV